MSPPTFFTSSLLVAVGGAAGSWLRFAVGQAVGLSGFPWATLAVNVAGSFAMGLLAGWLARETEGGEGWRLLLAVGVLGGFTTFSAFSLELAGFIKRGALWTGAMYAVVSLVGGVAGLFAGLALVRAEV